MAIVLTATQNDISSLSSDINDSTSITLRGPLHDGFSEWNLPEVKIFDGKNNGTKTQPSINWEDGSWTLSVTDDPMGHPVEVAFMENQPVTNENAMALDGIVTFHNMILASGETGDVTVEINPTRVKLPGYELGFNSEKTLSDAGTIQLADTVGSYAMSNQRNFFRKKYGAKDNETLIIFADGSYLITDVSLISGRHVYRQGGPVAVFGGTNLTALNMRLGSTPGKNYRDCLSVVDCPEVTQVGYNEFAECSRLSRINLPKCHELVDSMSGSSAHMDTDDVTFYGTAIVDANFPYVTKVGGYALSDIPTLKSVYLPKVEVIRSHAFDGSVNLEVIDFGNTMESVPELPAINAFKNVPNTCAIVVPDALFDEWTSNSSWANMASYYGLKFYKYTEWYGKPILTPSQDGKSYILGTQDAKPLQPAGDYATKEAVIANRGTQELFMKAVNGTATQEDLCTMMVAVYKALGFTAS